MSKEQNFGRFQSNKKNEFKAAICNSTEDYERVSTSLDYSLSNITGATKESVDKIELKVLITYFSTVLKNAAC